MNLLQTSTLCRSFGGLRAVAEVDFSLPLGQIRAIIGPNGAGKSTFVAAVCGRIRADSGSVEFDGKNITRLPAHRRIAMGMAYTFQITSVFSNLSVHENVALGVRRAFAVSASETEQRVMDALNQVGIADRSEQVAGDLSYGHQRLLEIAMGLSQEPKLFILDEPTQGLAESEVEEFKSLIRSISDRSSILLIEHNMSVVMETAEFITVMDAGRVLAEGTPEEVRANPKVQAAYLGSG